MRKPETRDGCNLPDSLWAALNHRLWHATSTKGLKGIVESGEIRIGDRYENSLCRHLGCVSIFDFGLTAKDHDQYRNWNAWFGHEQKSRVAVWLEIDRDSTVNKVYDAESIRKIWHHNRLYKKRLIPGVEAGHRGVIPLCVLKGALLIDRHDLNKFKYFKGVDKTLICKAADFEKSLPPPPPPHPLEIARKRALRDKRKKIRENHA